MSARSSVFAPTLEGCAFVAGMGLGWFFTSRKNTVPQSTISGRRSPSTPTAACCSATSLWWAKLLRALFFCWYYCFIITLWYKWQFEFSFSLLEKSKFLLTNCNLQPFYLPRFTDPDERCSCQPKYRYFITKRGETSPAFNIKIVWMI